MRTLPGSNGMDGLEPGLHSDPVGQAIEMTRLGILREQGRTGEADEGEILMARSLASTPHIAMALFASQKEPVGDAARALVCSRPYLEPLNPTHLTHYCPAAKASAIEALLDGPDAGFCLALVAAMPKPPTPGQLAMFIRRAGDSKGAARQIERARALGILTGPLLLLLAHHSAWCENGVGAMAQAILDQRAIAKSIGFRGTRSAAPRRI